VKNIVLALSLSVLVLLGHQSAHTELIDFKIHQLYQAPRSMSSGGTFSNIDDYNAVFYNPAMLARLKEGQLNFGIQAAGMPDILTLQKEITDANAATDKEQSLNDLLERNYGNHFGIRTALLSAFWVRPGWGIGIVPVDLSVNTSIHRQGGPQLNVSAYSDTTIVYGYAKNFLEDTLSVGASAKAVYRGYVGKDLIALDLINNTEFFRPQEAREGMTFDIDLGSSYSPDIPDDGFFSFLQYARPTFSVVGRNLVDYGFTTNMKLYNQLTSGNPPKLGRVFDVGTKWDLPDLWIFKTRFMFDVRDMGHRYWTFTKGMHTGFELDWQVFSWWKGRWAVGLGQGYFSFGLGAQLSWFRLDASTYAEEVGTTDAKKENRFYMVRLNLDF